MDDNGILLVINSTFNGNYAFQGLGGNIYSLGPSLIRNATLTGGSAPEQGGNIWAPPAQTPSTTLINTIVANPTVGGNCFGNIADGGGNLHYPSSYPCVGAVGDPRLGPLGNNYGPTQTMPLLAGSAAIDAVVNPFSCPETDQRGVLRAQGRRCDIGAYEVIPNITGVVGQLESSLMNFKSNLPRTGADKLTQQLIAPLLHSLDAMFWQADGNHINPQLGEQVFDLHQTVVNKLSELIDNEIEWTYIHNLLLADRTLAIAAMSAANCDAAGVAAPTNAKCAQAASQVALGDGSAAAGNYGEAIDHYKSAWGNATSPSTHE